ncbi:HAMP domain-containing histidine kinase [Janibacter sp. YIM B02568]|uniref:sensor histidine kinase n=1 Tax=Janibacter endophyticus TaxID=2806261 RepID=UPI00194E87C5|nr:HAMP domain-containing sensor histidine kinase [Janibacter endophyticus]MBM6546950.1 HAMP domain-containing histidine kinase [Janibacter endophyticus]
MRRRALLAAGLPLAVLTLGVVLPLAVLLGLVADDPTRALGGASRREWALGLLVWVIVVAGAAALVARAVAERLAGSVADALGTVRERVRTIGEGGEVPPRSGVAEIDALADAVTRRDVELARRTATDRDFAADAAHQLRTPLTALLMRLEELATLEDLEAVHEEAQVAIAQVVRLSGVVEDLRARTRTGEVELPVISLDAVLASLQREYQPSFAARQRSVRVAGERGLMVRARPSDLGQVIGALVENGLTHGEGTVSVVPRRSGPSVVVEIRDEGVGIPVAIAPHIFERSVTSSGSGLGLGLARDLAERNGGRLQLVQSQPAVFEVYLTDGRIIR